MGQGVRLPDTAIDTPPLDEDIPADSEAAGTGLASETNPEILPRRGPLRRFFRSVGLAEQAVGTACVVVILVLVLMQVAQRYLPGGGWAWTGEVARFAMVWCTFALAGYLMAHDRHIAIHVVDLVLQPRALAGVKVFAHLVVAATCVVMAYSTYRLIADDIGQRTAAAEIPLVWIYVVPLLGFVLTALRALLAVFVSDIEEIRRKDETVL